MKKFALLLLCSSPALASTSTQAVNSPLGANGFNVSFDGRLYVGRTGPGWQAWLLLPQNLTYIDGFPTLAKAFTTPVQILADVNEENALALCEVTPQPVACDKDGTSDSQGSYACYNEVVFNSDGTGANPSIMQQRTLQVIVQNPNTASASILGFSWPQSTPTLLSPQINGIEPTVTKDGHLMVWNGNGSANDAGVSGILYSFNTTACGASGWSAARNIAGMNSDPLLEGSSYPLAEKPMRTADGTVLGASDQIIGAYPWLFPSGEAVNFTNALMYCKEQPQPTGCGAVDDPCTSDGEPPGCGPVRNALSVIGYPTNWALSNIDGAVNPNTDDSVRLFFVSPTPTNIPGLPATKGIDVWPFFGSNTQNYTEIVFDDGLDGNYGGIWHMNEFVGRDANFDYSKTPDSSGYFNTGTFPFPYTQNSGLLRTATSFNGTSDFVTVPDAAALDPTIALSITLAVNLSANPDCDSNNNFRVLLEKGSQYSIVLEQTQALTIRVATEAGTYILPFAGKIEVGEWSLIQISYNPVTGEMIALINGVQVGDQMNAASPLATGTADLWVGAPGATQPACPNGNGAFDGSVDALSIGTAIFTAPPPLFADANNGVLGKSVAFDGTRFMQVADAKSLQPDNAITLQAAVKPTQNPDCDGNDNARIIAQKGSAYSLILEDTRQVTASFAVVGGTYKITSQAAVPLNQWTSIGASYDASSGALVLWLNGSIDSKSSNAPALLAPTSDVFTVAGPSTPAVTCPSDRSGNFVGLIDEVSVSSVVRDLTPPPVPTLPSKAPGTQPATPTTTPKKSGCNAFGEPVAWFLAAALWSLHRKRK